MLAAAVSGHYHITGTKVFSFGTGILASTLGMRYAFDAAHRGHCPQILDQLQSCLIGHFDVQHPTFQLEPAGRAAHEPDAHP